MVLKVWSPKQQLQHLLVLVRNAKLQALPQTSELDTVGVGSRHLCADKPSR